MTFFTSLPIFKAVFTFFIVLDSLGNVPLFASLLGSYDSRTQMRIILRESAIALAVMVVFLFFGASLFRFLRIDQASLQIAGGVILFLIAIRLVFSANKSVKKGPPKSEPFIVPLAVPAFAGPGILATISLYGASMPGHKEIVLLAIFLAWLMSVPILLLTIPLKRILGNRGLEAIEKLVGFILVLLAVQMGSSGFMAAFGGTAA